MNWVLAGALLLSPAMVQASSGSRPPKTVEEQVRHEILMLPYYSVFDNLSYEVNGTEVVLSGQVTWPVLRSDAEGAVRSVPGVTRVVNHIEVLPLSPYDNAIRRAELHAIYSHDGLYRYGMGTQPSIRIIVRNGSVTLEGVVNTETDRNMVGLFANQVPGVFSVTNNLRVVKS